MRVCAITCPLCDNTHGSSWGEENGFRAVKCTDCGLVYVSPRPDDSEITVAMKAGQHRSEAGQLSFVYKRSKRKIGRYRRRIRDGLAHHLPSNPVSWLDIGAGFGELVEALQDLLPTGSTIIGVEPMTAKAQDAAARGLPIISDDLQTLDQKFDFISMVNVFSHLPAPGAFLRELRPLFNDNGKLVLVTGNGGDLESASQYPDRLDLPDHLIFGGVSHVRRFLETAGFELLRTEARRLDTPVWALKLAVKRALGHKVPFVLPYRSPFRDMFFLAQKRSQSGTDD